MALSHSLDGMGLLSWYIDAHWHYQDGWPMPLRINETNSAVRTTCDFPKYTTSNRCHQHTPPRPQRCFCELNVPTALSVLHAELRLLLWGHHHQLLPLSRLMITDMCATGLMWSQRHQFDCGCWASSPVDGQHRPATCVEHWARDYGGGVLHLGGFRSLLEMSC